MNDEIDLLEIIRVLWKRKWLIIVPTIVVVLGVFLYFKLSSEKITAETKIYTKDLLSMVQSDEKGNKNFSILEYNRYITPIKEDIKRVERESDKKYYDIEIGEMESLRTRALKERRIYNFLILKKFKKDEKDNVKKLFLKEIDDFFFRFGKRIFSEFKTGLIMEKFSLEKERADTKLNLTIVNKKIDSLKKYLKGNKFDFVNISETQLTFLPPWQQYTGLSIQRDQINIALNIIKEKLSELETIIKVIDENKITSFLNLAGNEKIKKFKYYYQDIKNRAEMLEVLKDKTLNRIVLKNTEEKSLKIIVLAFILSLIFFTLLVFILE